MSLIRHHAFGNAVWRDQRSRPDDLRSSFGNATITLQFVLDRDIDAAAQDVQAAMNAAHGVLAAGIPNPPTYSKVNPADTPILTLQITSDSLPLDKITL